ncbi:hypothetical protein BS47DRAFT_1308346 [Hydnum rufescens UP504]|uniref:Nas2 N-terminal domain-containing protein n=1 Tax=Hydnum rufescens UP504 TaxID=1448309 RepID=A0A9P6AEK9_9AGAM|nr:hypothetical protein BS47DRAFT_1308346 [Hydnum rufescens UP504]
MVGLQNAERQRTLALVSRKEGVEAQIQHYLSILSLNDSTMKSPLVDPQGFPRADIDVASVRTARVRVIELRNDLQAITDEIALALQGIYKRDESELSSQPAQGPTPSQPQDIDVGSEKAFARVNSVAPKAQLSMLWGLEQNDLILRFGNLSVMSFNPPAQLVPIAELVAGHENRPIEIKVRRSSSSSGNTTTLTLSLIPRRGWGGGSSLLGCHIVPYAE